MEGSPAQASPDLLPGPQRFPKWSCLKTLSCLLDVVGTAATLGQNPDSRLLPAGPPGEHGGLIRIRKRWDCHRLAGSAAENIGALTGVLGLTTKQGRC